jgi:DNA processing protein
MDNLLDAMNLAYNTHLKARERYELAQSGGGVNSLPTPCNAVRLWHTIANTWLQQSNTRFWVSFRSQEYPKGLLELKDPPLILFGDGRRDLMETRSVAVVGSRNATRTGISNSHGFAKAFAKAGWAVVSGLAEGIDGAAHAGALEIHGETIAVLGCGPDEVYPKHHASLKSKIIQQGGLVLSEYPPGTAPQPAFFPRRNRIIAAISDSLLVVEAALRSGSLITARVASELGRPVAAIPGSIHSSQSKGCNAMIKKGALLIETAQELLDETLSSLAPYKKTCANNLLQEDHSNSLDIFNSMINSQEDLDTSLVQVLANLSYEPVHIDALAHRLGINTEDTLAALTELELLGFIALETGNRWVRINGVC